MMDKETDDLWPHFAPLWTDLRTAAPDFMLAGGYGLFLKHRWLQGDSDSRIAVSWSEWLDQKPRVTKDLDLLAGLEIVGNSATQYSIDSILKKHCFKVVEQNARWQFEKSIADERELLLEFHTAPPAAGHKNVAAHQRRVRHTPSLKGKGIHGRENREAALCARFPTQFELHGISIVVPHAIPWTIMKLVTMRDRLERSDRADRPQTERDFEREQAKKHAADVARSVAMLTREENAHTSVFLHELQSETAFEDARGIFREFFQEDAGLGCAFIQALWTPEGFQVIRRTLGHWFA